MGQFRDHTTPDRHPQNIPASTLEQRLSRLELGLGLLDLILALVGIALPLVVRIEPRLKME